MCEKERAGQNTKCYAINFVTLESVSFSRLLSLLFLNEAVAATTAVTVVATISC